MALEERTPLTQLPGIGPAKGRALARLGLERLGDLLEHFPQRYEDRRRELVAADPSLMQPEHRALLRRVKKMFQEEPEIFN